MEAGLIDSIIQLQQIATPPPLTHIGYQDPDVSNQRRKNPQHSTFLRQQKSQQTSGGKGGDTKCVWPNQTTRNDLHYRITNDTTLSIYRFQVH
jgi:hypothetical protein